MQVSQIQRCAVDVADFLVYASFQFQLMHSSNTTVSIFLLHFAAIATYQ